MLPRAQQIDSLADLRNYVYKTLCEYEQLEPGAFHFTERILVQGGKPCGIHFCLYGPRAVIFSAIWETRQNTVLFYSSTGERFQKTQLAAAPQLELMSA